LIKVALNTIDKIKSNVWYLLGKYFHVELSPFSDIVKGDNLLMLILNFKRKIKNC
jgi:hypothetical protein